MKPINISDRRPRNKQYVLIHLIKDNWSDGDDPKGSRYWTVAKFIKGISEKERDELPKSNIRKSMYGAEDEGGNNARPFCWNEFGHSTYFGQEVDCWCELPEI